MRKELILLVTVFVFLSVVSVGFASEPRVPKEDEICTIDTEEGKRDISEKGVVTIPSDSNYQYNYPDFCSGDDLLTEIYCVDIEKNKYIKDSNYQYAKTETSPCPKGSKCRGSWRIDYMDFGACIATNETESQDSDGSTAGAGCPEGTVATAEGYCEINPSSDVTVDQTQQIADGTKVIDTDQEVATDSSNLGPPGLAGKVETTKSPMSLNEIPMLLNEMPVFSLTNFLSVENLVSSVIENLNTFLTLNVVFSPPIGRPRPPALPKENRLSEYSDVIQGIVNPNGALDPTNTFISNFKCINSDDIKHGIVGTIGKVITLGTYRPYFVKSEEDPPFEVEDNELLTPGKVTLSWNQRLLSERVATPYGVVFWNDQCALTGSISPVPIGNILYEGICDSEDEYMPKIATYYCAKPEDQQLDHQVFPNKPTLDRNGICKTNKTGLGYCEEVKDNCKDSDNTNLKILKSGLTDADAAAADASYRTPGFVVYWAPKPLWPDTTKTVFDSCSGPQSTRDPRITRDLSEGYCENNKLGLTGIECPGGCFGGKCL